MVHNDKDHLVGACSQGRPEGTKRVFFLVVLGINGAEVAGDEMFGGALLLVQLNLNRRGVECRRVV